MDIQTYEYFFCKMSMCVLHKTDNFFAGPIKRKGPHGQVYFMACYKCMCDAYIVSKYVLLFYNNMYTHIHKDMHVHTALTHFDTNIHTSHK